MPLGPRLLAGPEESGWWVPPRSSSVPVVGGRLKPAKRRWLDPASHHPKPGNYEEPPTVWAHRLASLVAGITARPADRPTRCPGGRSAGRT